MFNLTLSPSELRQLRLAVADRLERKPLPELRKLAVRLAKSEPSRAQYVCWNCSHVAPADELVLGRCGQCADRHISLLEQGP